MLQRVIERCKQTGYPVIVAAGGEETAPILRICYEAGVLLYTGSEKDVLDRYYQLTRIVEADPVIRVTADCPFVDPTLIKRLVMLYKKHKCDLASVCTGEGARGNGRRVYPDGLDAECITASALGEAWRGAKESYDREHVTPYIWKSSRYNCKTIEPKIDYSGEKWSVDTLGDYTRVCRLWDETGGEVPWFIES